MTYQAFNDPFRCNATCQTTPNTSVSRMHPSILWNAGTVFVCVALVMAQVQGGEKNANAFFCIFLHIQEPLVFCIFCIFLHFFAYVLPSVSF